MDIRSDIFNNVNKYISDIESAESLSALTIRASGINTSSLPAPGSPSLSAFSSARARQRGQTRGYSGGQTRTGYSRTPRKFCKTCYDSNFGKEVFLSHQADDAKCPAKTSLNELLAEEELPVDFINELASEIVSEEITLENKVDTDCAHCHSLKMIPGLSRLQPVPPQTLSVLDAANKPVHMELDSAASVSFITLKEAKARNFIIRPNGQISRLGDGLHTIKSVGEIDEYLYRNGHRLRFRALICPNLHTDWIGGTLFLLDNEVIQDFKRNQITLLDGKCTVLATRPESLMPISPTPLSPAPTTPAISHTTLPLVTLKSKQIILPGDSTDIPFNLPDQIIYPPKLP